jgi:hypothetical protein
MDNLEHLLNFFGYTSAEGNPTSIFDYGERASAELSKDFYGFK